MTKMRFQADNLKAPFGGMIFVKLGDKIPKQCHTAREEISQKVKLSFSTVQYHMQLLLKLMLLLRRQKIGQGCRFVQHLILEVSNILTDDNLKTKQDKQILLRTV